MATDTSKKIEELENGIKIALGMWAENEDLGKFVTADWYMALANKMKEELDALKKSE